MGARPAQPEIDEAHPRGHGLHIVTLSTVRNIPSGQTSYVGDLVGLGVAAALSWAVRKSTRKPMPLGDHSKGIIRTYLTDTSMDLLLPSNYHPSCSARHGPRAHRATGGVRSSFVTSRVASELAEKLAGSTVMNLTPSVEAFNANRVTHCWVSDRPCIMPRLVK